MTTTPSGCQPNESERPDPTGDLGGRCRPPSEWVAAQFTALESQLVSYARRHLGGDWESAREVVQEAFAKLCQQAWPEIRPAATAWLYRTCRNRAIDITRRKGRIPMIQAGTDVTTFRDTSQTLPGSHLERREKLQAMHAEIELLTDQQQEVLRLRLKDGLSYQQIAEITGLTASNVGYHLHQAVSRLREKLGHAY